MTEPKPKGSLSDVNIFGYSRYSSEILTIRHLFPDYQNSNSLFFFVTGSVCQSLLYMRLFVFSCFLVLIASHLQIGRSNFCVSYGPVDIRENKCTRLGPHSWGSGRCWCDGEFRMGVYSNSGCTDRTRFTMLFRNGENIGGVNLIVRCPECDIRGLGFTESDAFSQLNHVTQTLFQIMLLCFLVILTLLS